MFADIAHRHGFLAVLAHGIAERLRMLWSRLAAALGPRSADIEWEDGESD